MCFEQLYDAQKKHELILRDGGMCRFHLRRDGQMTIHEIISARPGCGTEILEQLKQVSGATSILAKCPTDLSSNDWYARRGFILEATEATKSGRKLNVWRLTLN